MEIPLEDMLERAKAMGIDGLEYDLWRLEDRKAVKSMLDGCGMAVSSVYNMYDFPHEDNDTCERKYRSHLETAAFFGADKVLCIPGFIGDNENYGEAVRRMTLQMNRMCEAAAEYGITVTVEDFDDKNSPCSTTEKLEYLVNNVSGLKITFDTGNFAYCLENAAEAYDRLRGHIVHVHLKDRSFDSSRADRDHSNGKADLSGKIMYPCEVGEGVIGIDRLISRSLKDGYTGSFSLEHFGAVDQEKYMRTSAENIKRILKECSL